MKPNAKSADGASAVAAGVVVQVALDNLLGHPELKNRTIDKAHVDDLFQSLKLKGLDTALVAWDGGKPDAKMKIGEDLHPATWLVAGFHRREALRRLRKEAPDRYKALFPEGKIPVNLRSGPLSEMLLLQLRENVARKEPTPAELFPLLEKLQKEHKMKNVQIAKSIGKSEAWVSRMLSVSEELGAEGAEAVESGEATVSDLQEVAEGAKRARKTGAAFDKKGALAAAKAKGAAKQAAGKQRGDKRASAKTLLGRYNALPKGTSTGARFTILQTVLPYLAGESEKLAPELQRDPEVKKTVTVAAKA